jgi:hypothetical protein
LSTFDEIGGEDERVAEGDSVDVGEEDSFSIVSSSKTVKLIGRLFALLAYGLTPCISRIRAS